MKNMILIRADLMTEIINFATMSIANATDFNKKIIIKQLMQIYLKKFQCRYKFPCQQFLDKQEKDKDQNHRQVTIRRNQNNNNGQFWGNVKWSPKLYDKTNLSTKLMITNIPYQIGINQDDLRDLITRYIKQKYQKDQMNNCPVANVVYLQINQRDRNVVVELSSVEGICKICEYNKVQLFRGVNNNIVRLSNKLEIAKAEIAAFSAINILENKKTNFTLTIKSSTILRIKNAVTLYMCSYLTPQQWQDYHQDLIEGFSKFGTIVHSWFVKKEQQDICADAGNLFLQFERLQQAETVMVQMNGRIYDLRQIKIFYVPRQLYYQNFQKDIKPPTIFTSKP